MRFATAPRLPKSGPEYSSLGRALQLKPTVAGSYPVMDTFSLSWKIGTRMIYLQM